MTLQSKFLKTVNYPGLVIEEMEGKDWQPIMDRAIKLLERCDMEYQLGSGTLLGMIREDDGYIHHDTDIDLDIIIRPEEDVFPKAIQFRQEMIAHGFRLVRTQSYTGLPMQEAFIHLATNIIVDLCFFYKKWGTDYCNVYEHGVFFRPVYSVDEVCYYQFNKGQYRIPLNNHDYLTGRYGADYMTPKSGKDSGEKDAARYLVVL